MEVVFLGALLFLSFSTGGGLAWLVSNVFHRSNEGLALLCGGFLIGLLALDIIPSAFTMYNSFGIVLGILIGYIFFLFMHKLLFSSHRRNLSIYLLVLALFLHTIPLSLTIGNVLLDSTLGITITTSTILHHLPEGFALTSVFLSQGNRLMGLFVCTVGLAVCFGVFVWIGQHLFLTPRAQSVLLGASIGLLAITSVKELVISNIRAVPIGLAGIFIIAGYLLSVVFHMVL